MSKNEETNAMEFAPIAEARMYFGAMASKNDCSTYPISLSTVAAKIT